MRSLPSRAQIQERLNVIFPRSAFDPIHSCAQVRGQVGVSASTQHRPADWARHGPVLVGREGCRRWVMSRMACVSCVSVNSCVAG